VSLENTACGGGRFCSKLRLSSSKVAPWFSFNCSAGWIVARAERSANCASPWDPCMTHTGAQIRMMCGQGLELLRCSEETALTPLYLELRQRLYLNTLKFGIFKLRLRVRTQNISNRPQEEGVSIPEFATVSALYLWPQLPPFATSPFRYSTNQEFTAKSHHPGTVIRTKTGCRSPPPPPKSLCMNEKGTPGMFRRNLSQLHVGGNSLSAGCHE